MSAHIDTMRNWGSTQKDVMRQWSDPTSSTVAREMSIPIQDAAIPSRVLKNQYYKDWDDLIYPDKSVLDRVANIEKQIEELAENIDNISKPEEIVIREISLAQAKKEIRQYFKQHHGEDITAADIEDELGIDFELASEVCESFEREGKIKEA
jgi:chromosomal replication initiation ATPase DnaA